MQASERRAHSTEVKACTTIILLAYCPCASALNPSLDINQYAHTAWTVRGGFFNGLLTSIAQTPDGYLWLGTEFGLLRFDGVRNVPWQPPAGEQLPSSYIRSLLVARDGRLWIGTTKGLASWKDRKLTRHKELDGQTVHTLLEDREGTVWAGGVAISAGKLCAIQSGAARCSGGEGSFGQGVLSLYEDRGANLWAAAYTGLWRMNPGPPKLYPQPYPVESTDLVEGDNGAILIGTRAGMRELVDGKAGPHPLPGFGWKFDVTKLLRDRNGGLWIGTSERGLLHVHEGKTDVYSQSDGLSRNTIFDLFEDREGNIWVATIEGLDRFRDFAVATISVPQGLSNTEVESVLAARDGSVWMGTKDGLNRWKDGQITVYRNRRAPATRDCAMPGARGAVREITDSGLPDYVQSFLQDESGRIWVFTRFGAAYFDNGRFVPAKGVPGGQVYSLAEDRTGDLWLSFWHQGLFHLRQARVVERIPLVRLGLTDLASALLPDPVQGGLWLGFEGGLAYFQDGQVRASYLSATGLGTDSVMDLKLDRDGTLWAATEGGLSRVKNGRVATLTSRNGLPCDTVHWMMEDDAHAFWLYTACGLVRITRTELEAWAAAVDKDPNRRVQATMFDSSDGVRSRAKSGGHAPRVTQTADGKLWFLPRDGVSVIDPRHLPFNQLPPPVHVEQIVADGKAYVAERGVRLPPRVRDFDIEYTALSLVAPEKVHFRLKLEGQDTNWREVVNQRRVEYSNLPPGSYRFRVMACNNSGVWNETGDSLAFSVDAAYYQTAWFRAACVAAFLAMVWGLYRLRLHQIAERFNAHLEGRVEERLSVARELHDTLLQSFQASLLVMQSARNLLSRRHEQASETLDAAIDMAAGAITEGRDTIQNLRLQPSVQSDLAELLTAAGRELAQSQDATANPVIFEVTIEGEQRDLDPILQDEIYRIGREMLRNAFRHAHASRIEVEIRYDGRRLRMRIRDDGKGIDRQVLEAGAREGHFGLPGMRERARQIEARMVTWSEIGAGTEVELTVPARIAYTKTRVRRRFGLFRKRGEAL